MESYLDREFPSHEITILERAIDSIEGRLKSIVDKELGWPGMVNSITLPVGAGLHTTECVYEGADAGEILKETAEKYDELFGRAMECVDRVDVDGLFEVAKEAIDYNNKVGVAGDSGPLGELARFCLRAIGCHMLASTVERIEETEIGAKDIMKHNALFYKSILEMQRDVISAVKKDVGDVAEEQARTVEEMSELTKDITNSVTAIRSAPNVITLRVKSTDTAVHMHWVAPRGRLGDLWEKETQEMRERYRETKRAIKEAIRELESLI